MNWRAWLALGLLSGVVGCKYFGPDPPVVFGPAVAAESRAFQVPIPDAKGEETGQIVLGARLTGVPTNASACDAWQTRNAAIKLRPDRLLPSATVLLGADGVLYLDDVLVPSPGPAVASPDASPTPASGVVHRYRKIGTWRTADGKPPQGATPLVVALDGNPAVAASGDRLYNGEETGVRCTATITLDEPPAAPAVRPSFIPYTPREDEPQPN